jgi:ABC-2 type transport system ATP-binding protein
LQYAIQTENLCRSFKKVKAVENVNLKIKPGEIYGFLGPNGAGKTTTMRMLCTLLSPTSGKAFVGELDIIKQAKEVRKLIGLVAEKVIAYDHLTPMENLRFFGRLYNMAETDIKERADELLEYVEMDEWKDVKLGAFSSGMRQRINIIRALLHEPNILFLDEPTLGLDPVTAKRVRELILKIKSEREITIILTSHYMHEVEMLADNIGIIDHGNIVAEGSLQELKEKTNQPTLEDIFIHLTGTAYRDKPDEKLLRKRMMRAGPGGRH